MMVMGTAKKITAMIPEELMKKAQKVSGEGITNTIKIALESLAKREVYDQLASLKGSYKSKLSLFKLREDS